MRFEPKWAARITEHRGIHGRKHVDKERRIALIMIGTGFARVVVWTLLLAFYLAHVAFAVNLFASVAFVAVLSVLALMLTDWGQCAASLAQLSAAHGHGDAEAARGEISFDARAIEEDIAKLAKLYPGPESDALVLSIRNRLRGK